MKSKTIAVDLAKNVFEIGISDRPGQMTKTYRLSRGKFLSFFANQELATVVMEACSAAHHWGREIQKLGHTVVLISPQYVRPYVPRSKTDRADVKGLLEAHRNADIRAVPIKTVAQQQLTALHRIRSTWMRTRTARINMVRGLLGEFGLVLPTGARRLVPGVMGLIEDADVEIPMTVRVMFSEVCTEIRELEARIQSVERELEALARQMPEVARLRSIPGIGLLTSTAMVELQEIQHTTEMETRSVAEHTFYRKSQRQGTRTSESIVIGQVGVDCVKRVTRVSTAGFDGAHHRVG